MYTEAEFNMLNDALDMAINSNKRAQNSKHNPMFDAVYKKLEQDLQALKAKVYAQYTIKPDKK